MIKVRLKKLKKEYIISNLNTHSVTEAVLSWNPLYVVDVTDLDVYLEQTGQWKDLDTAFHDKDVVCDTHSRCALLLFENGPKSKVK